MNPVWARTIALGVAAAILGLAWHWAAAAALLGVALALHSAQLAAFVRWLRRPGRDALPAGRGIWEEAFAALHRHLKERDEERDRLRAAFARFREAGRALPDGVVILDREYRIEWANPTAARHFAIDVRRDLGQPVANFVRQPDFVAWLAAGDFREPLTLRGARGDTVLLVRLIEFGDDQKLLNSRDITAQERLETMRRDFVANVSHELKTPITVLAGFVETLSDPKIELGAAQRKRYLGLMAEQSRRMQQLIEDLLTLSALESSPAPADEQPIEARPLLEQLVDEARALSAGRHTIEARVESGMRLVGSRRELHSAFSNLVSNAVRYTPAGGRVTLAWREEGGRGVFSVEDTGIGVEPRHIPRLTERFYRVDHGRSRETGGTGLGLAIVKHVLTRHQASLEVESRLGEGSTFHAVFPAERLVPGDPAQAAA
ncbi:MAG TPA: phosphate regulon sensor histidine kinase PhoR [Burkholderiales bacterium]|nr:phosphate regulon sensor histidine kinase PhoR [Burkholderiales bacterium]